jgi:hypothetical protein
MRRQPIDLGQTVWLPTITKRECGDCRACCKVGSLDEWGYLENGGPYEFFRPWHTWCERAFNGGCMVYVEGPPRRPVMCNLYECAWKRGAFTEAQRPDKTRITVNPEIVTNSGLCWVIHELDPLEAERGRGRPILAELRYNQEKPVIIVQPSGEKRLWMPGAVEPKIYPSGGATRKSEAWSDHDHDLRHMPGGSRRCDCGYVDLRKEAP